VPADTARARLRDFAFERHGYFTARDARALNVGRRDLWQLAQQGFVERRGYEVYRFPDYPGEREAAFLEAVLLVGPDAYLIDTGTLAFLQLALVVPPRIRVGTPRRVRTTLPRRIEVVKTRHEPADITTIDGIPTVTVRRAILDARGRVMTERLIDAANEAYEMGLLGQPERAALKKELRHP
jgi:predicted transcriptional regulator of viral defense system